MPSKNNQGEDQKKTDKVGSDPKAAENFAGKHDFRYSILGCRRI